MFYCLIWRIKIILVALDLAVRFINKEQTKQNKNNHRYDIAILP